MQASVVVVWAWGGVIHAPSRTPAGPCICSELRGRSHLTRSLFARGKRCAKTVTAGLWQMMFARSRRRNQASW